MTGRPCEYTEEVADTICARLSSGESLRAICEDDDLPHQVTVYRWLDRDDEIGEQFRKSYARARERQADAIFDECLTIANTPVMGEIVTQSEEGGITVRREDMIAHRRLQVDTRKWMAGKLRPKKYGERVIHGGDADAPITVKLEQDADAVARAIAGLAERG